MKYQLHHGDCLAILPTLEDCSVDAIVTDPPAGIAFMGKAWDRDKGGKTEWIDWMFEVALQCRRVIKPGGHALVWAIPRTSHWTGSAWEDAGWQVRDKIYHVFGSGFPKSMDVSKAIDKAAVAEREMVGTGKRSNAPGTVTNKVEWVRDVEYLLTAPATPEAKQWAGWGTALKPAAEEWWLFRKPLEGTVAANVLKHGTGAINVDGCRIGSDGGTTRSEQAPYGESGWRTGHKIKELNAGRWPANFTHDGSDEVVEMFPQSKSTGGQSSLGAFRNGDVYGKGKDERWIDDPGYGDSGSAARFFYCAKASKNDRNEGCEGLEKKVSARSCQAQAEAKRGNVVECESGAFNKARLVKNNHPTVKPTNLMRYLCRLVTPPGGLILDPFMGSGSTGKAAMIEGFRFIGIEREADYIEIAKARLDAAVKYRSEFLF